jgi:hypothetical protein
MRFVKLGMVIAVASVLASMLSSCRFPGRKSDHAPIMLCVIGDCQLKVSPPISTDKSRTRYEKIYEGQPVIFCNRSRLAVRVEVDDARLLASGPDIFLQPGERFTTRARGNLTHRKIRFVFVCVDASDDNKAKDEEKTTTFDTEEEPDGPPGGTKNPDIDEGGG